MKKTWLKRIFSLFLIIAGLFLLTQTVDARECHSVYGGGEICENGDLSLDKKVFNPKANEYWDNIANSSYTFSPGEEIKFSLRVKNISDTEVTEAKLKDAFYNLSEYLEIISISNDGVWPSDETENMIRWSFGNLAEDEEVTVYFTAKVKAAEQIPAGTTCLTNTATAYSHVDDESNSDSASFCIAKPSGEILGESSPETGFDPSWALFFEGVALVGLAGLALSKARTIKKIK